jgi:hypothetical protein
MKGLRGPNTKPKTPSPYPLPRSGGEGSVRAFEDGNGRVLAIAADWCGGEGFTDTDVRDGGLDAYAGTVAWSFSVVKRKRARDAGFIT